MGFRARWVLVALLALVAGQSERAEGVLPQVRVGLVQERETVAFSGPAGVTVEDLRGGVVIGWTPPGQVWQVRVEQSGPRLVDEAGSQMGLVEGGVRLLPPEGGVVTLCGIGGHWDGISDRSYRGAIEIVRGPGALLAAVNVVDIETYLRGVVPSEMPPSYPLAALQAQAVAARGQALTKAGRHREDGFDLCAGQHCQVYGGATSEDPRSDEAVASTYGEVLVYDGQLADTLYSSNCGGHTANNEDYWPQQRPVPYLRGQPDFQAEVNLEFPLSEEQLGQYLKYAPRVNCNQPQYAKGDKIRWWLVMSREDLERRLREAEVGKFGDLLGVRVTDRAESGVVREVAVIGTRRLVRVRGGAEIRRALGKLNSASFAVEPIKDKEGLPVAYVIWGAGWGHQVGMCQVGAGGLADEGWDYRRILAKYYLGCEVARRY